MKVIPLTRGYAALVDDEDYASLNAHRWYANMFHGKPYAVRNSKVGEYPKRRTVLMHREILGISAESSSIAADHIEPSETLDNRRCNLRTANSYQNKWNSPIRQCNTSGYKGVYFEKESGKWKAQISVMGKRKNLGRFDKPELAHMAYRKAASIYHGEFARFQ